MIHKDGHYDCDYCAGRAAKFNAETGNHALCEKYVALKAENAALRHVAEAAGEATDYIGMSKAGAWVPDTWDAFWEAVDKLAAALEQVDVK